MADGARIAEMCTKFPMCSLLPQLDQIHSVNSVEISPLPFPDKYRARLKGGPQVW